VIVPFSVAELEVMDEAAWVVTVGAQTLVVNVESTGYVDVPAVLTHREQSGKCVASQR